eukprot:264072-Chlamydomonas_euryale.AAC.2
MHTADLASHSSPLLQGMLRRVEEVFDCWFESGSMPYAQQHYPFENKDVFENGFPADFVAEGLDQTRGWVWRKRGRGVCVRGGRRWGGRLKGKVGGREEVRAIGECQVWGCEEGQSGRRAWPVLRACAEGLCCGVVFPSSSA